MTENGSSVGLTMRELILEVRDDVKNLREKIDLIDRKGSIGTREELADHESRLRRLEGFTAKWSGSFALLVAIGAYVAPYVHS